MFKVIHVNHRRQEKRIICVHLADHCGHRPARKKENIWGSRFPVFRSSKFRALFNRYYNACRKPQTKVITTRLTNQNSKFARENFRTQFTIRFSFASDWPRIQHIFFAINYTRLHSHFESIT